MGEEVSPATVEATPLIELQRQYAALQERLSALRKEGWRLERERADLQATRQPTADLKARAKVKKRLDELDEALEVVPIQIAQVQGQLLPPTIQAPHLSIVVREGAWLRAEIGRRSDVFRSPSAVPQYGSGTEG